MNVPHERSLLGTGSAEPEARRVRALLEQTAEHEERPARNLVKGAVKRLRARQTAIVHVNEFFGVLVALVQGWTTLLSIEESPPSGDYHKRYEDEATARE